MFLSALISPKMYHNSANFKQRVSENVMSSIPFIELS